MQLSLVRVTITMIKRVKSENSFMTIVDLLTILAFACNLQPIRNSLTYNLEKNA